jgi:hypothetical protein
MAWLVRGLGIVVLFTAVACAELIGTRDTDVSVEVDVPAHHTLRITVHNGSPDPILLDRSPATQWFQYREDGEWRWPVWDHAVILPLYMVRIEPGEAHTDEFDTGLWSRREYRANLRLVDEREEPLPREPGISDPFRIEPILPLRKASGWRTELEPIGSPFAVVEIAPDRATAELAWRENVPDTLTVREGVPDTPGVYGDLSEIDFERSAVVVWSSGESGTCPEWVIDLITTQDGTVEVEHDRTSGTGVCTTDYRGYRLLFAVSRARLPDLETLPSERVAGIPDGIVTVYPPTR